MNAFSVFCLIATLSLPAAAMTKNITTRSAGDVQLYCPNTNGWNFSITQQNSDGFESIKIELSHSEPTSPPAFNVCFSKPLGDVRYLWHANDDGRCALLPSWLKKYHSDIASGVPVYTFLNNSNANRLTFAVAEPFRNIETVAGAVEDDALIEGKLSFFSTPEAPITYYCTEIRFDASNRFYGDAIKDAVKWISDRCGITSAPVPNTAFDPLYSTWYQFHQQVNAEEIEKECSLAASMGMKTIILDDGWQTGDNNRGYAYCGDWEVYSGKIPDMAQHVRNVHNLGLKYMIWYSVPFIGFKSKSHDRFKNMYLTNRNDRNVLDPRFPEVREFLCSTYEKALKDWDVDGFKLDFIDEFKINGVDPAIEQGYAGRDIKSLPESVDTLMTQIRKRLEKIRPDILIEFRQKYIGPAIRQYGNMLRANDCPCDARGNKSRIASLRLTSGNTAVHSDMLEWNVTDTPETASQHILSAIFGVIQYSMNLQKLPDSHKKMMKHWIVFSQKHRTTLLHSEFRPYFPQSGYPVIEAESKSELIIATYESDRIISLKPTDKAIYILNATDSGDIPVELQSGSKQAEIFDTFGNTIRACKLHSGIKRICVPMGGYIVISNA